MRAVVHVCVCAGEGVDMRTPLNFPQVLRALEMPDKVASLISLAARASHQLKHSPCEIPAYDTYAPAHICAVWLLKRTTECSTEAQFFSFFLI